MTHKPLISSRAFTLLELLVVVSIIILGTALLVPAFGRIIGSARYTGAVNTVMAGLGNARALAAGEGVDTALAFMFDPRREVMTLQVLETYQTGAVLTQRSSSPPEHTYATAFRPALASVPIELPPGIGVFGMSFRIAPWAATNEPGRQIDNLPTRHWYAGDIISETSGSATNPREYPWLFPRNDVRTMVNVPAGEDPWTMIGANSTSNPTMRTAMRQANTFFVRFAASGAVIDGSDEAYIEYPDEPRNLDVANGPQAEPFDRKNLFDPDAPARGAFRRSANPEVVMRSASQLAVVDLRRMSESVGIERAYMVRGANAWRPADADLPQNSQRLTPSAFRQMYYNDQNARRVSRYIDSNAEVISFNRFTGNAIRETAP